jgi:hypothetical protein
MAKRDTSFLAAVKDIGRSGEFTEPTAIELG